MDRRDHLRRARERLASGQAGDLRYAALDLRLCLEAMTYDKLQVYEKYLAPSFRKWQPPQLLKAMTQIDPTADQSFVLHMAAEPAVPGIAPDPENMLLVGEHKAFPFAWLRTTYNKLGNIVHHQFDVPASEEGEQRHALTTIADEIEEAQKSTITGSVFVKPFRFECVLCHQPIAVSMHYIQTQRRALCLNPNCQAQYDAEAKDNKIGVRLRAVEYQCECGHTNITEYRQLLDRMTIGGMPGQCEGCKAEYLLRIRAVPRDT